MTTATTEVTSPTNGDATATPTEPKTATVEAETTADEATELDPADPGDDSKSDSKDDAKAEVEKDKRKAQRRIDRLIAERAQRDERIRTLEAAAEAKANASENEDGTKQPPAEDPREIAKAMHLAEKTNEATAKVWKEASKAYGKEKFEAAIAELVAECGPQIDGKTGIPTPLLEAVLDSDRAAEILFFLGENPEDAAELMALSPARIGRRIAKIESDLAAKAKPKTSSAPKPLDPVKSSSVVSIDEAKMTDKQWTEEWKRRRMTG